jgi:hypothetical protein
MVIVDYNRALHCIYAKCKYIYISTREQGLVHFALSGRDFLSFFGFLLFKPYSSLSETSTDRASHTAEMSCLICSLLRNRVRFRGSQMVCCVLPSVFLTIGGRRYAYMNRLLYKNIVNDFRQNVHVIYAQLNTHANTVPNLNYIAHLIHHLYTYISDKYIEKYTKEENL